MIADARYTCTIVVPEEDCLKAIQPELLSTERTTSRMVDKKIIVEASDATALRAALATITRLLSVYEKTP